MKRYIVHLWLSWGWSRNVALCGGGVFANFDVEFFSDAGSGGVSLGEFYNVATYGIECAGYGFGLGEGWDEAIDFGVDAAALLEDGEGFVGEVGD